MMRKISSSNLVHHPNLNLYLADVVEGHGLGRLPAKDNRDKRHMMAVGPFTEATAKTRHWQLFTKPLDQGFTSKCVEFSWKHMILASPISHGKLASVAAALNKLRIYERAQEVDEWEGTNYDGTSVRAGAKILQLDGYLLEYAWAWDETTIRNYLLTRGPVVLGTRWDYAMFQPDAKGFVWPGQGVAGGHAYLALGYSHERLAYRCVNSWGPAWGQVGRFWLAAEVVQDLMADWGEACSAVESDVRIAA
jgi:hypothetical protein